MPDPKPKRASRGSEEPESRSAEAPGEDTEEWIYTVKSSTGELVKVEQVDKQTGERKEVPLQQVFGAYSYDPYAAYSYEPYAAYSYDPYSAYYCTPYGWWGY